MGLLLGLEPFKKFGVGGWRVGGGGQKAFKSCALVQTLDLDLKLGPSWTIWIYLSMNFWGNPMVSWSIVHYYLIEYYGAKKFCSLQSQILQIQKININN